MEHEILKDLQAIEAKLIKLYNKGSKVGTAIRGVRDALKLLSARVKYLPAPKPAKK